MALALALRPWPWLGLGQLALALALSGLALLTSVEIKHTGWAKKVSYCTFSISLLNI